MYIKLTPLRTKIRSTVKEGEELRKIIQSVFKIAFLLILLAGIYVSLCIARMDDGEEYSK
jgi:hypothetical protein